MPQYTNVDLEGFSRSATASPLERALATELLAARRVVAAVDVAVETVEGGQNVSVTARVNAFRDQRIAPRAREVIALGFDPSPTGAAFALLRVDWRSREWVECGMLASEVDAIERIKETLRRFSFSGAGIVFGVEVPVGGLGTKLGDDPGSRKRGELLIATAGVGHFIRGYATALGLKVEAMPSYRARRHLVGSPRTDAQVDAALRMMIPNMPGPRKTTNHVRDAAAVAFAAATIVGVREGWT